MVIDPLVVRIIDTLTGASWVYVFQVGPVRIGCGIDSSLPIARPFVSAQHGAFVFDNDGVRYQDLDPRAGTRVDGAPAGGRETKVTDWTQIQIGDLRLTTSRRLPDTPVPDPSLSPFARPAGGRKGERGGEPASSGEDSRPRRQREAVSQRDQRSRRSKDPRVERPPRRRVRGRFSPLAWLFAIVFGLVAVAAAGLLLQYRGLAWMPPELLSRVPPELAELFSDGSQRPVNHAAEPPSARSTPPATPPAAPAKAPPAPRRARGTRP